MKKIIVVILACLVLLSCLCGCSTGGAAETTEGWSHKNEKGPIDDDHYQQGLIAITALDIYMNSEKDDSAKNILFRMLRDCYNNVKALPVNPDSPCAAGNETVLSSLFLAFTHADLRVSDYDATMKEDMAIIRQAVGLNVQ